MTDRSAQLGAIFSRTGINRTWNALNYQQRDMTSKWAHQDIKTKKIASLTYNQKPKSNSYLKLIEFDCKVRHWYILNSRSGYQFKTMPLKIRLVTKVGEGKNKSRRKEAKPCSFVNAFFYLQSRSRARKFGKDNSKHMRSTDSEKQPGLTNSAAMRGLSVASDRASLLWSELILS